MTILHSIRWTEVPEQMIRRLSLVSAAVCLSACAPLPKALPGSEAVPPTAYGPVEEQLKRQQAPTASAPAAPLPGLPAEHRLPAFQSQGDQGSGQPALYSFKAKDLPLRDALGLLAKAHGLNILADPDVQGNVTVNFEGVPPPQAFDMLLSTLGYAWEEDRGVIRVRSSITRTFEVDYIRSSSGTGDAKEVGNFWSELESQIKTLLSPKGRLVVNRMTGAIMVTDLPSKVDDVKSFIDLMRNGMYRQIDIEVRIVEVTLRDQFALGLDWTRLVNNPLTGALSFNTLVTSPQAVSPLASTLTARFDGSQYKALIEALREQGDVRMVSQPRIRILNNQTARVKVGTDETFFVRIRPAKSS